ncbi:MAG: BrnT family toxin [bacterium]|nr:BrnT family toxin [bacterium]MBU1917861.1 BrnT family toxin [bacterium]
MYSWDENKSEQNVLKHGISFEIARDYIFEQRNIFITNAAYNKGEKRHAVIGKYQGKYYVGIFTIRRKKIRIISVRRARHEEEKQAKQKGL